MIKISVDDGSLWYSLSDYSADASLSTLGIDTVRSEYVRLRKIANERIGQLQQDASLSHMDAAKVRFPALQDIRGEEGRRLGGRKTPEKQSDSAVRLWLSKVARFVSQTQSPEEMRERLNAYIENLHFMGFEKANEKNWWKYRDALNAWRAAQPKSGRDSSPTEKEKIRIREEVEHPRYSAEKLDQLAQEEWERQTRKEEELEQWKQEKIDAWERMKEAEKEKQEILDTIKDAAREIGYKLNKHLEEMVAGILQAKKELFSEEDPDVFVDYLVRTIKQNIAEEREPDEYSLIEQVKKNIEQDRKDRIDLEKRLKTDEDRNQ